MAVLEFDTVKNRSNVEKHGISLDRATDMVIEAVVVDDRRDYGEVRYRAFGMIDNAYHCLVFSVRDQKARAISLRRAHAKEVKFHVKKD